MTSAMIPRRALLVGVALWVGFAANALGAEPARGHAHNDYYHRRPLHAALEAGMLSIEADVFERGGELLVAHDAKEVKPSRTLRSLYLQPLADHFAKQPRTSPSKPGLFLLVDFKSAGAPTWRALERQLADFPKLVTTVTQDETGVAKVTSGPVSVVVSGNRPIKLMQEAKLRRSGIDGRYPEDAESNRPAHLMPMVSASLRTVQQTAAQNNRTLDEEFARFAAMAGKQGRLARVWATPDAPSSWGRQRDAGLQLINTDHPADLAAWLRQAPSGH